MDTFDRSRDSVSSYPIDWSGLASGDPIANSVWRVPAGLELVLSDYNETATQALISHRPAVPGRSYTVRNTVYTSLGQEAFHEFVINVSCDSLGAAGYVHYSLGRLRVRYPASRWISLQDPYLAMQDFSCGSFEEDTLPYVGEVGVGFYYPMPDANRWYGSGVADVVNGWECDRYPCEINDDRVSFVSQMFSHPGRHCITLTLNHRHGGITKVKKAVHVNAAC